MSKDHNVKIGDDGIQVINQPISVKQLYLALIKNASFEILLVFPTINAIRREKKIGVIDELAKASIRGVKVRMLSPEDEFVKDQLEILRVNKVSVQKIENPSEAKFKLLIVDKKLALIVETKDDSRSEFLEAIGLATISNRKASVQPYVGIFESFWKETQLYEKARDAERIKDEFINIAAHELRNPIMPIITSTENLKEDIEMLVTRPGQKTTQIKESMDSSLNIISRNSMRLLQLSEDILQVSKIESGTFGLNIGPADLNSLINQALLDIKRKYFGEKPHIRFIFERRLVNKNDDAFTIFCDRSKITQAIINLLDNACKFTSKGAIEISSSYSNNEIIISVKDGGTGIDPLIKEKLFEKFTSKSERGVGLGLYITRKIVEAHGGRIWASDNVNRKGTTFSFTLPTDLQPKTNSIAPISENTITSSKALLI